MNRNAAIALLASPEMIVDSDLLGPLTVTLDELIEFPVGLFGFPECRGFVLVPAERSGLYWLQSAEHRALAFLLVDPFLFFDDYAVDLGIGDLSELQATQPSDIAVLSIVTLPRDARELPTANLQGPLAINTNRRVGKQLAISESDYGLRCPFDLAAAERG